MLDHGLGHHLLTIISNRESIDCGTDFVDVHMKAIRRQNLLSSTVMLLLLYVDQ